MLNVSTSYEKKFKKRWGKLQPAQQEFIVNEYKAKEKINSKEDTKNIAILVDFRSFCAKILLTADENPFQIFFKNENSQEINDDFFNIDVDEFVKFQIVLLFERYDTSFSNILAKKAVGSATDLKRSLDNLSRSAQEVTNQITHLKKEDYTDEIRHYARQVVNNVAKDIETIQEKINESDVQAIIPAKKSLQGLISSSDSQSSEEGPETTDNQVSIVFLNNNLPRSTLLNHPIELTAKDYFFRGVLLIPAFFDAGGVAIIGYSQLISAVQSFGATDLFWMRRIHNYSLIIVLFSWVPPACAGVTAFALGLHKNGELYSHLKNVFNEAKFSKKLLDKLEESYPIPTELRNILEIIITAILLPIELVCEKPLPSIIALLTAVTEFAIASSSFGYLLNYYGIKVSNSAAAHGCSLALSSMMGTQCLLLDGRAMVHFIDEGYTLEQDYCRHIQSSWKKWFAKGVVNGAPLFVALCFGFFSYSEVYQLAVYYISLAEGTINKDLVQPFAILPAGLLSMIYAYARLALYGREFKEFLASCVLGYSLEGRSYWKPDLYLHPVKFIPIVWVLLFGIWGFNTLLMMGGIPELIYIFSTGKVPGTPTVEGSSELNFGWWGFLLGGLASFFAGLSNYVTEGYSLLKMFGYHGYELRFCNNKEEVPDEGYSDKIFYIYPERSQGLQLRKYAEGQPENYPLSVLGNKALNPKLCSPCFNLFLMSDFQEDFIPAIKKSVYLEFRKKSGEEIINYKLLGNDGEVKKGKIKLSTLNINDTLKQRLENNDITAFEAIKSEIVAAIFRNGDATTTWNDLLLAILENNGHFKEKRVEMEPEFFELYGLLLNEIKNEEKTEVDHLHRELLPFTPKAKVIDAYTFGSFGFDSLMTAGIYGVQYVIYQIIIPPSVPTDAITNETLIAIGSVVTLAVVFLNLLITSGTYIKSKWSEQESAVSSQSVDTEDWNNLSAYDFFYFMVVYTAVMFFVIGSLTTGTEVAYDSINVTGTENDNLLDQTQALGGALAGVTGVVVRRGFHHFRNKFAGIHSATCAFFGSRNNGETEALINGDNPSINNTRELKGRGLNFS